jgi:1,4-dihydroxy-2-naphthoate octaprenyltransferase
MSTDTKRQPFFIFFLPYELASRLRGPVGLFIFDTMTAASMPSILGPMRIPFLVLNPVCVLLGAAAAAYSGHRVALGQLLLVLCGAVAAHVSVNALNEYHDFRTGLDFRTRRTPFSGGSGTLPLRPELGPAALWTGLLALAAAIAVGLHFLMLRGVWLLPVGLLGVVTVVTYTPYLTKNPWLCLVAPGVGFGTCMVMGTAFALGGAYSGTAFAASLVPFFLVSNLLLLNQFPDVEADRAVGRRHFPITSGRRAGVALYGLFNLCAYAAVVAGWLCGLLPASALLALATLFLAVPTFLGVSRNQNRPARLVPYLGRNVILVLTTPALLALGLYLGR